MSLVSKEVIQFNSEEIVNSISDKINELGVPVTPFMIDLVLKEYVNQKKSLILDGHPIEEIGLGSTHLSWRRVPKQFSDKLYTSKLVSKMDDEYKKQANEIVKSLIDSE